jgi:hypothetical protein
LFEMHDDLIVTHTHTHTHTQKKKREYITYPPASAN